MQKILLFVLVIFIVNVQSVDVFTQATIDKLVSDAQAVAAAAKGKAAASKEANTKAQALSASTKASLGPMETALSADYNAQKLAQDSYNLQATATKNAQQQADTSRAALATAHANVDANNVVVAALQVRKTAMAHTSTELTTNQGTLFAAIEAAGDAITALQTQNNAVVSFIFNKRAAIGPNAITDTNSKKTLATNALTAMGGGTGSDVCKTSLVNDYLGAVATWQAANVLYSTNAAKLSAYTDILSKISTELTGKVTDLKAKQQAVKLAATTLTINLSDANSVLGQIQKIINAEQQRIDTALTAANAQTVTLATALSAANSAATRSDSLWLTAKQALATQEAALLAAVEKSEAQQASYDTQNGACWTACTAAEATALTYATDAAAEKTANDMVALDLTVQAQVNAALANDKAKAEAAAAVVAAKAKQVADAAAAAALAAADKAALARKAGLESIATAVKAEVVKQQKADNVTAEAWNKSLKADSVTAKAACDAKVKAARDANKSSTKLNFSVLSLIAGLLIITMN